MIHFSCPYLGGSFIRRFQSIIHYRGHNSLSLICFSVFMRRVCSLLHRGEPLVECWVELLERIPERAVPVEEAVLLRAGATSIPLEVKRILVAWSVNL